jgi:transposase
LHLLVILGITVITMSRNELTRLRVLIDVADGRLSVADATGLIGVGQRQIYRLLQAFRADGADGLISRKRGGPSNRALGSVFRETVLAIVRERYADLARPWQPRSCPSFMAWISGSRRRGSG